MRQITVEIGKEEEDITVEVGIHVVKVVFVIEVVSVFAGVLQLFHFACSRPSPRCSAIDRKK